MQETTKYTFECLLDIDRLLCTRLEVWNPTL